MTKVRFVGLDVHKESRAVAESVGSAPETVAMIPNDTAAVIKRLKTPGHGAAPRWCYEAGPTGFVLQRALAEAGIDCIVIAPSLVLQKAGDDCVRRRRGASALRGHRRAQSRGSDPAPRVSTGPPRRS